MSREKEMSRQQGVEQRGCTQGMEQRGCTQVKKKPWPENCPWPEPLAYSYDYDEEIVWSGDDETQELLDIKEYFDSLVKSGRLNEDYTLNEDYVSPLKEFEDDEDGDEYPEDFTPVKGEDYWDDGFDIEAWREDLSEHVNLLRIAPMDPHKDPVIAMRSAFSYHFVNENLLRQAFTRRSFQIEHNLSGCSEELEFLGDTVECRVEGYFGWGVSKTKVKAKKKAAYMVIVNMLISAGICKDEWHDKMIENMTSKE